MSQTEAEHTATLPITTGDVLEVAQDHLVLAIPGTDYRLRLVTNEATQANAGVRIRGVLHAKAKRVDVIQAGGRYVEPVYGRPRRIQGRIIGGSVSKNTLHVDCGAKFVCKLMPIQKASDFSTQQLVSFDVEPGTTIELVS